MCKMFNFYSLRIAILKQGSMIIGFFFAKKYKNLETVIFKDILSSNLYEITH